MRPTSRILILSILLFAGFIPGSLHADESDNSLDSNYDLRAKTQAQEDAPLTAWTQPFTDSWSLANGGNPFSQGGALNNPTYIDTVAGIDIGDAATVALTSLEDLE
jgi:hypothetical protein